MPSLSELDAVGWAQVKLAHDCRTYAVFDRIREGATAEEIVEERGATFVSSLLEAKLIERDGASGHFRLSPAGQGLLS